MKFGHRWNCSIALELFFSFLLFFLTLFFLRRRNQISVEKCFSKQDLFWISLPRYKVIYCQYTEQQDNITSETKSSVQHKAQSFTTGQLQFQIIGAIDLNISVDVAPKGLNIDAIYTGLRGDLFLPSQQSSRVIITQGRNSSPSDLHSWSGIQSRFK